MRKSLSLLFLALSTNFVLADVPENWNVNSSALTVEQQTGDLVSEGTSSAKATWTSQSNQDLDSDEFNVTGGTDFSFTVQVNDNDPAGRVRLAVDWSVGNNTFSSTYSVDMEGWQTNTLTGTVPANATTAHVKLRFYDVSSNWDGDAVVYLDNAIFTNGGDNLLLNGGFETWVAPPTATPYTILQIQTPGADGDASQHVGELVETSGTVTAVGSYFYFLQDGSGAWNGVYVYNSPGGLAQGDNITIEGSVTENNGLTQITGVTSTTVNSSGNTLPAAVVLGTGAVGVEDYEGVLVNTSGACDDEDLGYGEWSIDDGTGPIRTDDAIFQHVATLGSHYSVTGPLNYNYGNYKIYPRSAEDVVEPGATCADAIAAVVGTNTAASAPMWYSYTATVDGNATVSACDPGGVDTYLYIYSDCAGTLIDSDDDYCGTWDASQVTFDVVTGTTYYINWGNDWSASGFDFTIEESSDPLPMPDLEITSISVTDGVGSALVTNIGDADAVSSFGDGGTIYWYVDDVYAGYEYPDPYAAGASVTHVIDGLTLDAFGAGDHELKLVVNGSEGDGIIESDYTNNADSVVFTIDAPASVPQNLTATAGDGVIDLDWEPAPVADGVNGLIRIAPERPDFRIKKESYRQTEEYQLSQQKRDYYNSTNRDRDAGESCADPIAAVVGTNTAASAPMWYSYTATVDGSATVSACDPGGVDTYLYIYSDCAGTLIDSDDDYCGTWDASQVTFDVVTGTTYYINWGDDWSASGFDFTIEESSDPNPMPDLEITSISVTDGVGSALVTNIGDADAVSGFGDGGTIYWYVDDVYVGYEYPDPYAAGASVTHVFDGLTYDAFGAGDHELKLVVNGSEGDGIIESDYTNNADSVVFTIDAPQYVPTFTVYRDGTAIAADVNVSQYQDTAPTTQTEYCYTVTQNMEDATVSGASDPACATVLPGMGCSIAFDAVSGLNTTAGSEEQTDTDDGSFWYTYTATVSGAMTISSCFADQDADTRLFVYAACGGALVADNDDAFDSNCGTSYSSEVEFACVAGTSYKIQWSNYWGPGTFNWTLDEFDPATIELTATPGVGSVDLGWTTIDTAFWTPTPAFNSYSNEDGQPISLFDIPKPNSDKVMSLNPYVQGDHINRSRQGGDTFADATVVTSLPYNIYGTTAGYTDDYDEACTAASTSPDVVYSYTATEDNYININTCGPGSAYDTKLFVYDESGTSLACNDDACSNDTQGFLSSIVDLPVSAGSTYYIVVDGWGGESGEYELNVLQGAAPPEAPANDLCENATAVSSGDEVSGTTEGATADLGGPGDVWYAVELPHAMNSVTISLCNSAQAIGTGYGVVFESCENVPGTYLNNNSLLWYECPNITYAPTINWTIEGPGTAYIPVITQSASGTEYGPEFVANFTVEQIYSPTYNVYRDGATAPTYAGLSGNEFVDFDVVDETEACYTVAQIMPDGTEFGQSNTACATPLTPPPGEDCDHAIAATAGTNSADGQPVWYKFTATQNGFVTISSQDASGEAPWDTDLYVYGSCDATTTIAENDDGFDYYGPSIVTVSAQTGDVFYMLWADSWQTGAFTFTIEETLPAVVYPPSNFTGVGSSERVDLSWSYPVPPAAAGDNPEDGVTENHTPIMGSGDYDRIKREHYRRTYEGGSSRDLVDSDVTVLSAISNGDGTADIVFNITVASTDGSWADGCALTFPAGVTVSSGVGSSDDCGDAVIDGQTATFGDVLDPEAGSGFGCFADEHQVTVTVSMYDADMAVGWYLSDDCWGICGDLEGTTTAPVPTVVEDCQDDVYEPNTELGDATFIAASDTVTGLTICIDDVDWFASQLASNSTVTITMIDTTGSMGLYFWDLSVDEYSQLSASGNDTLSVSYTNLGGDTTNIVWWYGNDDYYNPLVQSSYNMQVVFDDPINYTYNIYSSNGTLLDDTTGYAYAVTGLVNGTEYGFYATTKDENGNESDPTPTVLITPTSEPLLPPENLQGEAGVLSASLTWDIPFDNTGDVIETALVLDGTLPLEVTGTTTGYTDDYDEECTAASTSPDFVYSLSPTAGVTVDIDLCGSAYDTKVFVYEDSYTPGAPYACDDDANGSDDGCGGSWTSLISGLVLSAGSTYYIVVDGWGGDFGDFTLHITESTGRVAGNTNPVDARLALELKTLALEERNANRTNDRDLLGYVVHRSIQAGSFSAIDTVAETAYLDNGLTADIEHNYQVTALYPDGESTPEGPVTVVPVEDAALPTPTALVGEGNGWMAELSWTAPDVGGGGAGEGFEGGEIPDGWDMQTLADCGDFSGWYVTMDASSDWWSVPPGDGYYIASNDDLCNSDGSEDYLTLPSQDFTAGGLALSFDSYYSGAYGQVGQVKVSVDNGATFDLVWMDTPAADWVSHSVDLSAYAGESNVLITFWSNDADTWASGWAIDNVSVGTPADFNLLSYNVYIGAAGSEELVGSTSDTSYSDFNPELGTYTYSVKALYQTYGESDPSNYADVEITGPEPTCNPPRNLVANAVGNNVNLTWEAPAGGPGWNLSHTGPPSGNAIGLSGGDMDFSVAARFDGPYLMDYHGQALTKIQFVPNSALATYQVSVWTVSGGAAPVLSDTSEWISGDDLDVGMFNVVELSAGITIDWETELYIGYRVVAPEGENPAAVDAGPDVYGYGGRILFAGTWYDLSDLNATLTYNWCIEGFVDNAGGGRSISSLPVVDLSNIPNKVTNSEGTFSDLATELNFVFPPGNTVNTSRSLLNYLVYRDGEPLNETEVGSAMYNDDNAPWGDHTYWVTAWYDNDENCGESMPSNEFSISLVNHPPPAPSLLQPNDNASIVATPTNGDESFPFIWTAVNDQDNDPVTYVVSVSDDMGVSADTAMSTAGWFPTIGELSAGLVEDEVSSMTYTWTVFATDSWDSSAATNGPRSLTIDVSAMLALDGIGLPEVFALYNNYPNPFNPVTNITYDIPEVAQVTLEIYNVSGQKVRTLAQGQHEPGRYRIEWNATNDYGNPLSSGMYIYRIHAGDFVSVKKLVLMK